MERFGGRRAIILQMRDVWSGPRDYMGYAQLFINLKERPALVEAVVQQCVDHYIRVIERAAEMGSTLSSAVTMSPTTAARCSRPNFGRACFSPTTGAWSTAIHDCGLYHWKHSDGNMYPLLDSIVAAGSDGIDPIDPWVAWS